MQSRSLLWLRGAADLLLIETVFDTLNAKAALFAASEVFDELGRELPVMVSFTIPDLSGRTLSGQTVEAFLSSIAHVQPFAVGLNCGLGAKEILAHARMLARASQAAIIVYPNAGMPNELGQYVQTPEIMAEQVGYLCDESLINIVGGCCGTSPDHIKAIVDRVAGEAPRALSSATKSPIYAHFSGLERVELRPESGLLMVGERTNIMGSRRFARLIREENFERAVDIAAQQVRDGANIIDINLDDPLVDSAAAMRHFLRMLAAEPDVARVPVMLDSSHFEVIEAGLQELQGRGIVNSLSLKEGEALFVERAQRVRRYGAALVVMAFDEEGQASTKARRVEILARAHRLLTQKAGYQAHEIIFDPNILTVATGMPEHDALALDFIETCRELKRRFPLSPIVGGISNLSFAFRGRPRVREAMHAVFLYHASRAGLDMAIINAGQLAQVDEIDEDLRSLVEDVILARRAEATESLVNYAARRGAPAREKPAKAVQPEPHLASVEARLAMAVVKGELEALEVDLQEGLNSHTAQALIEGPLMDGMNVVGERFGAGKMFLPQVVKSARVMRRAVDLLTPVLEAERSSFEMGQSAKILLATVKGDVHDIGKNIVRVVLECSGYEITDLGVMVPMEQILQKAKEIEADVIGLSALIAPSLHEMAAVANLMQQQNMKIPLMIGGAATSALHTALKLAPLYDGPVLHVRDASVAPGLLQQLLCEERGERFKAELAREQEGLRERYREKAKQKRRPLGSARRRAFAVDEAPIIKEALGVWTWEPKIGELRPLIDWEPLYQSFGVKGEARNELLKSATLRLDELENGETLWPRARVGVFDAWSEQEDIVVAEGEREKERFFMLRQQHSRDSANLCLADFVAPQKDHVGAMLVSAGGSRLEEEVARLREQDEEMQLLITQVLAGRVAEACAEWAHRRLLVELGLPEGTGTRPAIGYPACPDHSEKRSLFELLDGESIELRLNESWGMEPQASVAALVLFHPDARTFAVGRITAEQLHNYARRKGISIKQARQLLPTEVLPLDE